MKLVNKKTGEVVEWFNNTDGVFPNSLAELNEEWEDYKEPEEYWYIGYKNDIRKTKYHHISNFADNQVTATRKEIGNCFETEEEAKNAVKKLKAWKRLKELGFCFVDWELDMETIADGKIWFDIGVNTEWNAEQLLELKPEAKELLDIIFGGE